MNMTHDFVKQKRKIIKNLNIIMLITFGLAFMTFGKKSVRIDLATNCSLFFPSFTVTSHICIYIYVAIRSDSKILTKSFINFMCKKEINIDLRDNFESARIIRDRKIGK